MSAKLKHSIFFLLAFLLVNTLQAQKNSFDHLKLATDLDNMAQKLKMALAADHSNLPGFNVVNDFGAINTGLTITTRLLQKAIDSCSVHGPSRLYFPAGVYLTGTLILKSGVHIVLAEGAKILGSTDENDYQVIYPAYKNNTDLQVNKSLFYAENVDGISFSGKEIIDFQGTHPVYLHTGNNDPRRPFGIRLVSSKNIYVSGLLFMNSPQWLQHYLDCENLMIENINVFNHAHQNNDGLDIDGCRNAYVSNCHIDSDDDAICLKSNGPASCENVLIENCTAASHCNSLKLGTESTGGFKNIIFRKCKVVQSITGTHYVNGVETTRSAITLIISDGGKMENIWIDNIESTGCVTPIFITLGNRSRKHTSAAPVPAIGSITNILISNLKATGAGPVASSITGLNNSFRINNVKLKNLNIEISRPGTVDDKNADMDIILKDRKPGYPSSHTFGNFPCYGFYFKYINGLQLDHVQFSLKCVDPRKAIITEDCNQVIHHGSNLMN